MAIKVVTGRVRLSYVDTSKSSIYTAKPNKNGALKFGCRVMLPKSDTATYKRLKDAELKAAREFFVGKPESFIQNIVTTNSAIHDGDGVKPNSGEPYEPECAGHWVFNPTSGSKPDIVDADLNPMLDKIGSGDYCRVSLSLAGYKNEKSGVGVFLNNIQFLGTGERLDGRTSAATDFAEF